MKLYVLFLSAIIACTAARAQERLGIANSNYSSTNSIFLNPSSSVDARTYWQCNIIGFNAFLMTNMGYVPKFSFWSMLKGSTGEAQTSNIKLKQFLYANASLEGPCFVIAKEEYGAGIFVRARTVGQLGNVPYKIANLIINNDQSHPDQGAFNYRNMHFNNMSWIEYGLNFGKMIKHERNDMFTLGASLRYLMGINLVYGNLSQLKGYYNDSILNVQNVDGKLRYNEAGFNTGNGVGLDVGFTYKKMMSVVDGYYSHSKKSNCNYVDYKYKIGIALRDLGYIKFNKNTTASNVNSSGYFNTSIHTSDYLNTFQVDFNTTTTKNTPLMACLPTSMVFQFDYNFEDNFYLNTTVVKNLVPNSFTGVQSPNLVSICPRYEFKLFEVAMPLTFQRFLYPQLGLAFRVRTFVLGFDNLFPLFIKKNTYGINMYMNIGFSRFKSRACNLKSRSVNDCPKDMKGRNLDSNTPRKRIFKRPKRR